MVDLQHRAGHLDQQRFRRRASAEILTDRRCDRMLIALQQGFQRLEFFASFGKRRIRMLQEGFLLPTERGLHLLD